MVPTLDRKWWLFLAAPCLVSFLIGCLTVAILSSDPSVHIYDIAKDFQTFAAACVAFAGVFCGSIIAVAKIGSDEAARKEDAVTRSQAYYSRIEHGARVMASCSRFVASTPAGSNLMAVWKEAFSKRCHNGIDHAKATCEATWSDIGNAHPKMIMQLVQAAANLKTMVEAAEELCTLMDEGKVDIEPGDFFLADGKAFHVLRSMDRLFDGQGLGALVAARPDNFTRFRKSIEKNG